MSVSIFSHLLEQESPTRGLQGCAMRSAATFVEYIYTDIIIYIEVYKLYVCELRYFTKDVRQTEMFCARYATGTVVRVFNLYN